MQISNSSSTLIILQTAKATVLNPDENHSTETRLLFDSCSQRTYCTDDLKRKLNLKKVRSEVILLKRFAPGEGVLKELDVLQICIKGKLKAINIYIEALCIPFICSTIPNQDIDFSENSTKHLLRLQLADTYDNNNKPVDILVGLDYFYNFISGKIIKGAANTLEALECNLG